MFRKTIENQKGQGLVEYVIIVALVSVACMSIVRTLQGTIRANLATAIFAMQDNETRRIATPEKVRDDDLKSADFGNFMNGAKSRDNAK